MTEIQGSNTPIVNSEFTIDSVGSDNGKGALETKKTSASDVKTALVAKELGISEENEENKSEVIIPKEPVPPPSSSSPEGLEPGIALNSIKNEEKSVSVESSKIAEKETTDQDDGIELSEDETSISSDTEVSSESYEYEEEEFSEMDIAIYLSFPENLQEAIYTEGPEVTKSRLIELRNDISEVKKEFQLSATEAKNLEDKITHTKKNIIKLKKTIKGTESTLAPSGKKGKRTMNRHLLKAKARLGKLEASRTSHAPDPKFQKSVLSLIQNGELKAIDGGKSGVYFLKDKEGKPRFVVKPYDEDMLTLNNPKGLATPYKDADGICRPKAGIPLFSAAKNEHLTGVVANEIGVAGSTAKSQMMILKSESFHDITDGIDGDKDELHELYENYGSPDKEKLCIVQEFIPDCKDIGEILLDKSNLSQLELMGMDSTERNKLERSYLPTDIDQDMYEDAVILALVSGECDGNAGGFLIADKIDSNTGKRPVYKIDNAATFTEDNSSLITGSVWLLNCSDKPMSDRARSLVKGLNSDTIANLMKEQGYSSITIDNMKERVLVMKMYEEGEPDITIGGWTAFVEDHLENS